MKRIFTTSSIIGLQLLLLAVVAIILMFFDHRSTYFHNYRDKIAVVVLPLQVLVDSPIRVVHRIVSSVVVQNDLVKENARLHVRQLLLESKLQRLLALEQENTQLHELLQSTPQIAGKVVVAQLLAVDLDPALQQVIVDKGAKNNIYIGQPVFDAYGVLGQVISVGLYASKILLLTDTRSAIPVQDYRNGIRAIALGSGSSDKLTVINVPDTADVRKGDLFVTSGLGMRFPGGYPVGVVDDLQNIPGERFASIALVPSVHLDQTQQVLLVWPDKAALSDEVRQLLSQPVPTVKPVAST